MKHQQPPLRGLSRRSLLHGAAGLGVLGATLHAAPGVWLRRALAAAGDAPRRTLVLLHLAGGNDGLNTVVPYTDKRYSRLRPGIAIDTGRLHKIHAEQGLHPSLGGLAELWRRERLAIVQGVGYPKPNLSHFRATEIWHTAQPERNPNHGWLGRAMDGHKRAVPLRAVALTKEQPLSLAMATPGAVTLTDFSRFQVPMGMEASAALYRSSADEAGPVGALGQAGSEALDVAKRIASLSPASTYYPGTLGQRFKKVEALLGAKLNLEVIQLEQGGYDTHSNQAGRHARLLTELGNTLRIFQNRLERMGLAERVVTVVFSEFGRRASENLSGGTDHGTAGPVFVVGKGLRHGLHGAAPSLDDLDRDNLRYTTDFRSLYASLLGHCYDINPEPVLGKHAPLELFV